MVKVKADIQCCNTSSTTDTEYPSYIVVGHNQIALPPFTAFELPPLDQHTDLVKGNIGIAVTCHRATSCLDSRPCLLLFVGGSHLIFDLGEI